MTGKEFIILEGSLGDVLRIVLEETVGFADSEEISHLDIELSKTPGLVFSALFQYLTGVHERLGDAGVQNKENLQRVLSSIFQTLEKVCIVATDDAEVENYITTEFFEYVDPLKHSFIASSLGEESRKLFEKWSKIWEKEDF